METICTPSRTHTVPLPPNKRHENSDEVPLTPKERLRTVEEFVEQLEQAVLERL